MFTIEVAPFSVFNRPYRFARHKKAKYLINALLPQVQAVLEAIVVLAEFFQGREEWKSCAQWCERAITFAKILPPSPLPGVEEMPDTLETCSTPALEASLLTLRGT